MPMRQPVNLSSLPILALNDALNLEQIATARKVSAAAINISGRQRMLCQRIAFFALRFVASQEAEERATCRASLLEAIDLMDKSHKGLVQGDPLCDLSDRLSPEVRAIYFQPPFNLDERVLSYIKAARALVAETEERLTQDNPHLGYITDKASAELLAGLDAVVNQYQQENETEQLALDFNLTKLYQQNYEAMTAAAERAKQLEKALRDLEQSQEKLIQSEKLSNLGMMVAGLAHEIKNPANCIYGNVGHINGYIEDLLELMRLYRQYYPHPHPDIQDHIEDIELDFLLEDLPKILASMQFGTQSLRDLVISLQNFARVDGLEMTPFSVEEGINSTLLILQHRLKGNGGSPGIEVVKDYGALPKVECHPSKLSQVFMNILSNAIEALQEAHSNGKTPAGRTPTIAIRTSVEPKHKDNVPPVGRGWHALDNNLPGQLALSNSSVNNLESNNPESFVTIAISDNGPGMTEEIRQQLFAPFFTTKPAGKGTGLGLSISSQIVVRGHGGLLWCVSEPGRGTEFWIKLPVKQITRSRSREFNSVAGL